MERWLTETNSAPTTLSTNTFTTTGLHLQRLEHRRQRHRHGLRRRRGLPLQRQRHPLRPVERAWSRATPVTFNGNASTSGTMANETDSVATRLSAPIPSPRSGYSFTGWNTAANGTGTAYADGAGLPLQPPAPPSTPSGARDHQLHGHLQRQRRHQWHAWPMRPNSAPTALEHQHLHHDRLHLQPAGTPPPTAPARPTPTARPIPFSASATLYAQWSAVATSYTVTFNGNGAHQWNDGQ